ncbi:MAG: hypothetical protein KDA62_14505 [Planctomycetales bacterium]|nr:hypothetical protein [Planctomycetales bacterium]
MANQAPQRAGQPRSPSAGAAPSVPPEEQHGEHRDYDSWYSALASFVFHFCATFVVMLLAENWTAEETLPPAVDIVQVAEATSEFNDAAEGLPTDDIPELSVDKPSIETPTPTPAEALNEVVPVDIPNFDPTASDDRQINEVLERARQAAAAAKAAVAGKMADNLGGSPSGGEGGTGRSGRAARWVLTFDTRTPQDYLKQMGGLGAEVAFPDRGDRYRYFTDLAGSPKSSLRDLASENRIYWVDENPQSYMPVAQHLGVGRPPIMIAFLPVDLEQQMLKLELAYNGPKQEEDVEQTVFKAVRSDNGYKVIVIDQTLRN